MCQCPTSHTPQIYPLGEEIREHLETSADSNHHTTFQTARPHCEALQLSGGWNVRSAWPSMGMEKKEAIELGGVTDMWKSEW